MKSLATQARSDVLSDTERNYLDQEFQEMSNQIDFISTSTKFNGQSVINGSMGAEIEYGDSALWDAGGFSAVSGTTFDGTLDPKISVMDGHSVAEGTNFELSFDGAGQYTLTNTTTGEHQDSATGLGNSTSETETLDFDELGVRVSLYGWDADAASPAGASETFSYGDQASVTAELTGDASAEDTFTVAYNGTDTFTVTNNATSVSENATVTEAAGDMTVKFSNAGLTLNLENMGDPSGGDEGWSELATWTAPGNVETLSVKQGASTFQVGLTAGDDDISVDLKNADSGALEVANTNIKTIGDAATANGKLDTAIEQVNEQRAKLGANMSRVEKINENLATTIENLDAARSTLMDVDVAEEMTKFSTNQVMTQAATAMLAQANQLPQNLMRLLQ
jgi:flagellin